MSCQQAKMYHFVLVLSELNKVVCLSVNDHEPRWIKYIRTSHTCNTDLPTVIYHFYTKTSPSLINFKLKRKHPMKSNPLGAPIN